MKLRQQYHFSDSSEGILAWDVLKLIKLSNHLDVKEINLSDIDEFDESYWHSGPDLPRVRDYADHAKLIMEADIDYPIILCSQGRVMDGMHRVCKAYVLGKISIKAVQFSAYIKPDFVGKKPSELPY